MNAKETLFLIAMLLAAAPLAARAGDAEDMRDAVAPIPDVRSALENAHRGAMGMIPLQELKTIDQSARRQNKSRPEGAILYVSEVSGSDTQLVPDWFVLRMLSGESGSLMFQSDYGIGPMSLIPRRKRTVLTAALSPGKEGGLVLDLRADGATISPSEIALSGKRGSIQKLTIGVSTKAGKKDVAFSFTLTIHSGPAKAHVLEEFNSASGYSYSRGVELE